MTSTEKVRENRLRRVAARQGLRLEKSPRRDPLALDYGRYRVVAEGGRVPGYALTLDEVERSLTERA